MQSVFIPPLPKITAGVRNKPSPHRYTWRSGGLQSRHSKERDNYVLLRAGMLLKWSSLGNCRNPRGSVDCEHPKGAAIQGQTNTAGTSIHLHSTAANTAAGQDIFSFTNIFTSSLFSRVVLLAIILNN